MEFSLYRRKGDVLMEDVEQFKYLGHPLNQTDDNWMLVW